MLHAGGFVLTSLDETNSYLYKSKQLLEQEFKMSQSKRFVTLTREFKKLLRQRRGQRKLQKMTLYFTYESRDTLKSFSLFLFVKTISKLVLEHNVKFEI